MSLSTHVLDASTGRPASGVTVTLSHSGAELATGVTDGDGRISGLGGELSAGIYRLRFDTGAYFAAQRVTGFYPEVVITFEITDSAAHHHVPLLLSPYSYSTYRGS
ncbi:hydroxyisourate hydrolase [Mycolicibacterium confluentis]|uniref:5-hydroxyisourate hydrolase n=1 Tax=Mycolicibacterium confluentis TaxID=28047 RepID=A0A7I7XZS2_9MYCO|nr:hydroxyisourate hydrolase [Mycolicibacterium confluentis]MCV7319573.1 hydroxyisourate hydrolase [Mycolicibacterium confluentis]ORV34191.1 5-hydroxyisourate hydrolase [Mycolicibacterium confluentis]BBZ34594.1 5-hydroxyisourate hydrolase [Mycolicibacterium confluentis]